MTIKQIATEFGISETCLQNWLREADVEQEKEVLRRAAAYFAQAHLPGK